jgi:hypothetical protein
MERLLRLAALALFLAFAAPSGAEGGKKPDLEGIGKFVASFLKKKDLGKKDPEEIGRKIAGLAEGDLQALLERLRGTDAKDRGAAAPAVERIVEDALLSARYTPAVLHLPDAARRLADPSPEARCALASDLSRLEDAEPATRFVLWALEGGADPVRLRAVDTLADLCSWGGDGARILPALRKALDDPSPAVRDVALERLANLADPAALDWAVEHMGEPAEETALVRGVKDRFCPGDRALEIATRVSRIRYGIEVDAWRELPEAERTAAREEIRKWRAKTGGNPLRDGEEGPFDPIPKVASAVVDPLKSPTASVRWWSEVDRAQFRLDLDEMQVTASSRLDWSSNFRLTVIASGARQGDWEAFARRVRCGSRHRLPRRGFALVETAIQPLLDGRWKIWVRSFEPR